MLRGIRAWLAVLVLVLVVACGGGGGGGTSAAGPAAGAYTLTVAPGSLNSSVPASGTATVSTTVEVVPANGFAGTVAFSVEGLPAGVTAAFSPAASDTATTLQLTIAAGAAQGSVRLSVKGRSAGTADTSAALDLALYTSDRLPVLAAVEDQLRALVSQGTSSPADLATAIAAFMQGRSEYVAAGVDPDAPECAWGELQNGRMHVVLTSPIPLKTDAARTRPLAAEPPAPRFLPAPSGTGIPVAAAAAAAIPSQANARLIHSFGPNFEGQDPIDDARTWLKDAGWQLRPDTNGDASLDILKGIGGDGFFYLNTHGGMASRSSSGLRYYCLCSSTRQSASQDAAYGDDWEDSRIVYFTARNGEKLLGIFPDWDTWYGITYRFVRAYWHFPANSVFWVNACYSQTPGPAIDAFRSACHAKGAGTYLGWTQSLGSAIAYSSIRYYLDRCLGANRYHAEFPAQRPFPSDLVLEYMGTRGLARGGNGEVLEATPQTTTTPPALLAPSIRLVEVDEYSYDMKLKGSFGSDAGVVTVGGAPVAVRAWGPEEILCTLPRDLSGDVLVKVRGIKSNPRPLTQWTVPFIYTWTEQGAIFTWTGTGTLRYRLDVSGFRTKPGEAPTYLRRGTWPVWGGAITVNLAKSSVITCPISATTVTMPTEPCALGTTAYVNAPLIVDAGAKTGLLGFTFVGNPSPWMMLCDPHAPPVAEFPTTGGLQTTTSFYLNQGEGTAAEVGPLPAVNVTFGPDLELIGGVYTSIIGGEMKLDYQNPTQSYPPRPGDAGI